MRTAALLVAGALVATRAVGCGGDDSPSARSSTLAPPQHVTGRYSLDGQEQVVRSTVAPTLIAEGRRNAAVAPKGRRAVQVDVRIADSGRDPINPDVLRFTARDSGGTTLPEKFRVPIHKLEPTAAHSPRVLSVGFFVARGARLSSLGASSILRALPLRLRWRLAG
jgi:hypothetical protein